MLFLHCNPWIASEPKAGDRPTENQEHPQGMFQQL
jgi:hypothetical protein